MKPTFSFCERVWAGPRSPWHIREIPPGMSKKLSGGIQTAALCGHPKANEGWDIPVEITEHHLAHSCKKCVEIYRRRK